MSEKFARGRSSEVFRQADGKVLKLFFAEYPEEDAVREFNNTRIAFETGCTKMNAYELVHQDDRTGIIMDFVEGVSQNDMPTKNPLYIFRGGTDLARMHVIVHSRKSHDLKDVRLEAVEYLASKPLDILNEAEKEKAKNYILSLPEDDTIIHLDFHTGNVLVAKDGSCTVIDWMTACRGNRAVEYAMMEFLFTDAELFPEASALMNKFYGAIRTSIGKQYYREYQKKMPLSAAEVQRWRIIALIIRRYWNIEFEKETLSRQIRECLNGI